jgi:hypothetical protein
MISSAKVGKYTKISFWAAKNYKGRTMDWENDDACFIKKGFNDLANSFQIATYLPEAREKDEREVTVKLPSVAAPIRPHPGCVLVFAQVNFGGRWAEVCGSNKDLGSCGLSKTISSVKIGTLTKLYLWTSSHYNGESAEITADESDLTTSEFKDITISLQVFTWTQKPRLLETKTVVVKQLQDQPPSQAAPGCALLFADPGFQGVWTQICGSAENLTSVNLDKRISSLKVGAKTKIRLFTMPSFGGKFHDFEWNVSDLLVEDFDNMAVSAKLFVYKPKPRLRRIKTLVIKSVSVAAPARPQTGCALIFEDPKYQGKWAQVCGSAPSLTAKSFDKMISSVKIGTDTKMVLWSADNFEGKSVTFTADEAEFIKISFDNMASSIQMFTWKAAPRARKIQKVISVLPPQVTAPKRPQPGCGIIFEHVNFKGKWAQICGNNGNLKSLAFEKTWGSIQVGALTKLEFWGGLEWSGKSISFTDDNSDLVSANYQIYNKSVKTYSYRPTPVPSKRVVKPVAILQKVRRAPFRPKNGCVLVFDDIQFSGKWSEICGNVVNLTTLGFNDNINSMKVAENVKAELYENVSYGGRIAIFTADESNFVNKGFNAIASSMKIYLFPIALPHPVAVSVPVVLKVKPGQTLRRPAAGCVRLFELAGYSGKSLEFCYSNADFKQVSFDDMSGSIWVGESTSVSLFENAAYSGRVEQFTKDEADFHSRGWVWHSASSAKIFSLKMKCTNFKVERAPLAKRKKNPDVPTFSISGGFKNALTGKFMTELTGFSVVAQGADGKKFVSQMVGSKYLFPGLAAGKYEFSISGTGFIGFKVVREVTKVSALLNGNWDWTLSPSLLINQWRFVLTWGASPKDLDSTVIIRKPGKRSEKIYYRHRKSNSKLITLDVDNTIGFGPETITLSNQLDEATKIGYYVHNYSRTPSITVSNAKVVVYNYDHEVISFAVPKTGNGLYWHVFNFTLNGLVETVDVIKRTPN